MLHEDNNPKIVDRSKLYLY